jgi:hypothetical protein
MPTRWALFALCSALLGFAAPAPAQSDAKPVISLNPLTAEELAVYRAVLAGWMDKDTPTVNLADRTVPPGVTDPADDGDKGCGKGLDLEPSSPTLVRRFRPVDLTQLGLGEFRLIDPGQGAREMKKNDPENAIRKGESIEDAVRNGFAHGLFTLSEIQFDKKHEHAIVSYSFVCGGLWGSGATLILKKTAEGWQAGGTCDNWISLTAPPSSRVARAPAA